MQLIKFLRIGESPAVDEPERIVYIDISQHLADELLGVITFRKPVQLGDKKGHLIVKPRRKQAVQYPQHGIEIVQRRVEHPARIVVKQFEQLLIDADGSLVIARLQEIGRLEQLVEFIHLEPVVRVIGDQVQLAQHQIVQALALLFGTHLAAVKRPVLEDIVKLHVLVGAAQMLERLVHFHLFFDQLLFAHPLIIPGTQVTQFRLPDQHEQSRHLILPGQFFRPAQLFGRGLQQAAAEKDLRLGHAVGNAGLDIVTAP